MTLDANVIKPNATSRKISKLVLVVTSLPFSVSLGTEMTGARRGIAHTISFDSWPKEDYEKAATSDLIMNESAIRDILLTDVGRWANNVDSDYVMDVQEQILDVVRQKYEYAGGCARYMFDMDFTELKTTLDDLCRRVPDWKAFTKTSLPPGNGAEVVNCLMQQFVSTEQNRSVYTPVSKYILLRAYHECRAEVTAAVRAAAEATYNRSLLGWAFELDQKDKIYSALQANRNFFRMVSTAVTYSNLTFFPQAEAIFNGNTIAGDVANGSVIWCLDGNQPLFDVALYFQSNLITRQFTVSDSNHSLYLQYMRPLCMALVNKGAKIVKIVHLTVLDDNEVVTDFKFTPVTGHAQNNMLAASDPCCTTWVHHQSDKLQSLEVFRLGPQATSSL